MLFYTVVSAAVLLSRCAFISRIAETLNVPKDHTFGVLMKPDGFGNLIHLTF